MKGLNPWRITPLRFLYDQPGPIRAYKLVCQNGEGPFAGGIIYEDSREYAVAGSDTDEAVQCAAGINLATMDWCLDNWRTGYRILVAEFKAARMLSVPQAANT